MTTICYRGGVLAADTRLHAGGEVIFQERASKIWRVDRSNTSLPMIAGMTGDFSCQEQFEKFLLGGGPFPEWEQECSGITITSNEFVCSVRVYGRFGGRYVVAPFVALGSGSAAAMAAMHMGADARRVVEIAMLVDPFTGGEIDVLKLDGVSAKESPSVDVLNCLKEAWRLLDVWRTAEARDCLMKTIEFIETGRLR